MDSLVDKQTKNVSINTEDIKYYVQDPFLAACIGMGRSNPRDYSKVQGFNCAKDLGYALLAYFTSRALNISRLPFCEDRIYNSFHIRNKHEEKILLSLDEEKINVICREIIEIYQHTQKYLQKAGKNSVNLCRKLHVKNTGDYTNSLLVRKVASEILEQDDMYIEMDSLNSFTGDNGYHGLISLQLEIPAKDILYCHKVIDSKHETSRLVEPGEWVVINRSPTGVVRIPTSNVLINDKEYYHELINKMDSKFAKDYLSNNSPLVIRKRY